MAKRLAGDERIVAQGEAKVGGLARRRDRDADLGGETAARRKLAAARTAVLGGGGGRGGGGGPRRSRGGQTGSAAKPGSRADAGTGGGQSGRSPALPPAST